MAEYKESGTFYKKFNKQSSLYDDFVTGRTWFARLFNRIFWHDKSLVSEAKNTLEMIPNNFTGKMLDVPCGTGVFTKDLYLSMQKAQIIALDYSVQMIDRFKLVLEGNEYKHVSFVQGDVGALQYEDESFDLVLCMNGYQCFPDKDGALSEIKRVLKTGGLFIGCTYVKGVYASSDFLVSIYDRKGIMSGPHENLEELKEHFSRYFTLSKYVSYKNTFSFTCIKD
ncbi:MAG: class I SAM-dependent methyltransferase [Treponema sp.]